MLVTVCLWNINSNSVPNDLEACLHIGSTQYFLIEGRLLEGKKLNRRKLECVGTSR